MVNIKKQAGYKDLLNKYFAVFEFLMVIYPNDVYVEVTKIDDNWCDFTVNNSKRFMTAFFVNLDELTFINKRVYVNNKEISIMITDETGLEDCSYFEAFIRKSKIARLLDIY